MRSDPGPFDLLVWLYRHDVRITSRSGRLNVSGAFDLLSPDMLHRLGRHKAALQALLDGAASDPLIPEGIPLSHAQQEIWAVQRAHPTTTRFNLASGVLLRGRLDVAAVAEALNVLVERHGILRSRYTETGLMEPRQSVRAPRPVVPSVERCVSSSDAGRSELLRHAVAEQTGRAFDLDGDPLLDLHLVSAGDDHTVLTLRRHHIASDGSSFAILVEDFCRLYAALVGGRPVQPDEGARSYAAFVAYEAATVERLGRAALRAYWRDRFERLPSPAAAVPPSAAAGEGRAFQFVIDAPTVAALRSVSRRCGESLYVMLFALFRLLLNANDSTGADCIGIDATLRDEPEFRRTVGLFVNRLPIIHPLDPDEPFETAVGGLGRTIRGALTHKWLAHHEISVIARAHGVGNAPLFRHLFGFHNNPHAAFSLPGCSIVENFSHSEREHDVPFVCYLTDIGATILVNVAYRETPEDSAMADDFSSSYLDAIRLAIVTPTMTCGAMRDSIRKRRHGADAAHRHSFKALKRRLMER